MLLISQNKEKVLWFGSAFNALEYSKYATLEGNNIRHAICISGGRLEKIAEYPTKERCMEVLKDFCEAYKNAVHTCDFYDYEALATRTAIYMSNRVYEFPAE